VNTGPGGRTGLATYPGITTGSLFLSLAFTPAVEGGDIVSTYKSSFDSATVDGGALGYLDVTGGSHAYLFDTNTVFDPNGGAHDFVLTVTFNAQGAGLWTVKSAGQAQGFVPEPGTLLLLAGALAALAGATAKRRRC
jgi:hypothetical protein